MNFSRAAEKCTDVVLVPDNDSVGCEHVNIVGASLVGIAKRIRVLILPGLGNKGDVIDWARAGGTREQLDELIAKAPDWIAPADEIDKKKDEAKTREDELLDALAKMHKGLGSARERKRLAKEFKVYFLTSWLKPLATIFSDFTCPKILIFE